MKKLFIVMLLTLALVLSLSAAAMADTVAGGTCGADLTWTLDSNGKLTISGTGAMTNYQGSYAPWYNSLENIKSINVEDGVTSVGGAAFKNCHNLTGVTIPDSVMNIGVEAFRNCISLTSVTIPSSVTSLGNYAFAGCRSLTSVTIPEGVTSIGDYAFYYCSSLTEVTIPDGVTSIGDYAFFNCSSLTDMTIPDSVTSIGGSAFDGCVNLTNVTIPSSVTSIGNSAFAGCSSLTEVTIPDGVTSIGDYAFFNCSSLTDMTIPDSVTSIGDLAFQYCTSLTSVTIPDSVTSIGEEAFYDCRSLTAINVDINNPAYFSQDGILFNKTMAELICYPGGKSGAYIIPDSVTSIGDYAFYHCYSLSNVTIPASITSIGKWAFSNCRSLTSLTIPASVTSIGEWAIGGCDSLTAINVDISNPAYFSQDGILFNKTMTELICYPCGKSGAYSIPASVTSIGYAAFFKCKGLSSLTIPASVTSIGWEAFDYCNNLTSAGPIGSGCAVEFCWTSDVPVYAFNNCHSLISVTIPDSVTSIGYDAFVDCTNLTDVYYGGTEAQWDATSIESGNDYLLNATIHYNSGGSGGAYPDGIIELSPLNGVTGVGKLAGGGVQVSFSISFNEAVGIYSGSTVSADFSKGTISLYRYSDDKLIWSEKESGSVPGVLSRCNGSGNKLSFSYGDYIGDTQLDTNTKYYITIDEGVIKLSNGKSNPAVRKGDWVFTTINGDNSGTFAFRSHIGSFNAEYQYEYSDSYFYESSFSGTGSDGYNHELAKLSLDLALSAFNAHNENNTYIYGKQTAAKNVISLMHEMGFIDVDVNSYEGKPETDSIAYAIGKKQLQVDGEEFTLIAIAVRGGGYEAEWASNFCVHSLSSHLGFVNARTQVYTGLLNYIRDNVDTGSNIKLWIAGYSRGAAVANLLAGYIDDGISKNGLLTNYNISRENVYAYTFATPMGISSARAGKTSDYNNIYNIINPVDIVTKVAPSNNWGYARYGCSLSLPSVDTNSKVYKQNKEAVYALAKEIGLEKIVTVEKTGVTDQTIDIIGKALYPPDGDASIIVQTLIGEEIGAAYGYGESPIKTVWAETEDERDFIAVLIRLYKVLTGIEALPNMSDAQLEKLITGKISSMVRSEVEKKLLIDDAKSFATEEIKDWASDKISSFITTVAAAHYPELYLAWMNTIDSDGLSSGLHRKQYYNCPVDIKVFDEQGNLAASIINDEAFNIEGSFVSAYVDPDGQKVFILPPDQEYQFNVIATADGEMTYTVIEENANGEIIRVVSYYEVEVQEGDELTGLAENLGEVESAQYPLTINSDPLTATVVTEGDAVQQYTVAVDSTGNGEAYGGGSYVGGEFSKVIAEPEDGEDFLGWYIGDEFISEELEYRFLVDKDVTVTARFSSVTGHTVTIDDRTKGAATVSGITDGGSYSGETPFTVTCDKACVVAYTTDDGENYTVLTNTGSGSTRSFTLTVSEDTEVFIALVGDVDLSGDVTRKDATLLSRFMARWKGVEVNPLTADIDASGAVARKDATLLSRRIAKWTSVKDYFEW